MSALQSASGRVAPYQYMTYYKEQIPLESEEHIAVADYLNYLGLLFNHSPNEGIRKPQYVVKLKRMGMSVGFPDFFIYEPRGGYHGLAIELKRRKCGRVTEEQKKCLKELSERGYYATVCYGFDDAKAVIDRYLKQQGEK